MTRTPSLRGAAVAAALFTAFSFAAPGAADTSHVPQWAANPPAAFIPPPLHPDGIELRTQQLAPRVYALLSDHVAVDNNGFVVEIGRAHV